MQRVVVITAGACFVVNLLATGALARPGAQHRVMAQVSIAIKERGSTVLTADKTFKGRFSLVVNGAVVDSGTTVIRPSQGAAKIVGGQRQTAVVGSEDMTSAKGTISFSFRGISVTVNALNPGQASFDNEYGTWRITAASGTYKGWKGGGNWALVGTPSANNIEWDGNATHS